MIVKELIQELSKCNPNDIVMYDPVIYCENNNVTLLSCMNRSERWEHMGVDDARYGSGTLKGFVFLMEEKYNDNQKV